MTNAVKKFDGDPPWWYLLLATAFTVLSVYLYFFFIEWEAEDGGRTINWVIALIYEIGGKWTVIALAQALVWFCIYLAVMEYKKRRTWR